ncbi:anti-phage deoxyguanosine triphosphatase [Vibrio breoganii]|uniref:Deoxyguanosinetriphosphate triphosphohydrolase-like protein n=1 Tax=Vibrio breoganii TaxID=553239 RepID=A0AAN1CRP8_9VIBR|nr:anti-phage deoxyguanosine triphosphatase [Vibrio breoganii]ANO32359.1 dGTPase [Vibrio breoganii]PMG75441.1 dGTPase [Vibrio breoganii]PMO32129.1 dGTPase [Vibrio breoganii]PMO51443.1 dGTPase [Vibrio breoganii]
MEVENLWQQRINEENKARLNDHRDPYQRDRARVLHSAAFRRLQAKTQVHGAGGNDFHRTRLTHSLEAAQIGSGILAQLQSKHPDLLSILPTTSLIETLCLAHDIGHPPYGHGGEVALNYMMREHGGFEGNAQTFRIVSQLEPYTQHHGMNLCRRTLLGLLKYPSLLSKVERDSIPDGIDNPRQLKASRWTPAKGVFDIDNAYFEWVLQGLPSQDIEPFCSLKQHAGNRYTTKKTRFKSLDCSIMELADDIAYGVHDLEDAIVLGLVSKQQWLESAASKLADCGHPWMEAEINRLSEQLFSGEHYLRKDAIGSIVNALLTSAEITEVTDSEFSHPLVRFNATLHPPMLDVLEVFKVFVSHYVIQATEVQLIEYKGQQIVIDLFEALSGDPERLLPEATKNKWRLARDQQDQGFRVICDYISAMTDGYAQKMHSKMFAS